MKFRVLPDAQAELVEAVAWYEDRQNSLGTELLKEVRDAFQEIRTNPESLAQLETYSGPHNIRRIRLKRFPYLIILLCRSDETVVIAVAHARRRPLYWLKRLSK